MDALIKGSDNVKDGIDIYDELKTTELSNAACAFKRPRQVSLKGGK
ncbi:hypothetical protein MAH4_24860 [Sessilibacter sp. MAH4]